MKASEVLELLKITRQTLYNYVKEGRIKTIQLPNKRYVYDKDDVYNILTKMSERYIVAYTKFVNQESEDFIQERLNLIEQYCSNKNYNLTSIFYDTSDGDSFTDRPQFFKLLDIILDKKIKKLIISEASDLGSIHTDVLQHLFKKNDCELILLE